MSIEQQKPRRPRWLSRMVSRFMPDKDFMRGDCPSCDGHGCAKCNGGFLPWCEHHECAKCTGDGTNSMGETCEKCTSANTRDVPTPVSNQKTQ